MFLIIVPLQRLVSSVNVRAFVKLACLSLMVALFASCTEKKVDFTETFIGNYVGSYTGTAQNNFYDYKSTFTRKDTVYTNVQVAIARSTQDNKKVTVSVYLPTGEKRYYSDVDVSDNKLNYHFSARGCGCTQSISGDVKDNVLRLSLFNYETTVLDSRISVEALKNPKGDEGL